MEHTLQKCGHLLTCILIFLWNIHAKNVTSGDLERYNLDSSNETGQPIIELLASSALQRKQQPYPEQSHETDNTGEQIVMQASYADPYSDWHNEDDSHVPPAAGPYSPSSPYDRDLTIPINRYQQQQQQQPIPYSNNQPRSPPIDDQWPLTYPDDQRQMSYDDDNEPIVYPNDHSLSAPEMNADALEYMSSQMEAMKPALKNAFLSNILDFLFHNSSNGQRDSYYQPYLSQQPIYSESDLLNYQEPAAEPALAPNEQPSQNEISKRTIKSSDLASFHTEADTSRSLSPLQSKQIDNLESLLKMDESSDLKFQLRDGFLRELAMPIIIKPIIVAVPESQIGTESSKVVDVDADNVVSKNPIAPRSINQSEAMSRIEDNVIRIPQTKNGSPNTWYVYGKQNYLILQSDNSNMTKDLIVESNGAIEPEPNNANEQIDHTEAKTEKTKRCDCEVKCHTCNDGSDQTEAPKPASINPRRSPGVENINKRNLPSSVKKFPKMSNQDLNFQMDNIRQYSNRIRNANSNQLLSFDDDDSRSAEAAPEYSDLDFIASEAGKYKYKDGEWLLHNDRSNQDQRKDVDNKKYFDEDMVKSYIESLRSMNLHGEKSMAVHNDRPIDVFPNKDGVIQLQNQALPNAVTNEMETSSKELVESYSEKHNIVKKNLSPDDVPPATLETINWRTLV